MKRIKEFLRKFRWYRWCEANDTAAHIVFSAGLAQSFWLFNLLSDLDKSALFSFIFSSALFVGKELGDMSTTGFGWKDLLVNYATWTGATITNILIWCIIN